MMEVLVVEEMHDRVHIYDKLGGGGAIELTMEEAERTRDRLDETLDDKDEDVITEIEGDVSLVEIRGDTLVATSGFEIPRPLIEVVGMGDLRDTLEESPPTWTLRWGEEDDAGAE